MNGVKVSIKLKLIVIFFVIILISVVTTAGISLYYAVDAIDRNTRNNVDSILKQSSENVDMKLKAIDSAVSTYVCTEKIYSILKREESLSINGKPQIDFYRTFSDIQFLNREIESIHLYDLYGKSYGFPPEMSTQNFYDLLNRAIEGDGQYLWMENQNNTTSITYTKMYYDSSLRPVGLVEVNVRRSFLSQLLNWQKLENGSTVFIISGSGEIFLSSGDNQQIDGKQLLSSTADSNGRIRIGEKEYYCYTYNSTYNDWVYASLIPAESLLQDAAQVRKVAFTAGSWLLVVFSLVIVLVVSKITRPIKLITRAMQQYNLNQVGLPVKVTSHDEIGYLSDTFNQMTQRISSLIDTAYKNELILKDQQFKILQAQINPHFLYNTFDMISWTAREHQVPEIGKILKALSNVMRYTIDAQSTESTIADELDNIENYLAIQKFRYGEQLQYNINAEDRLRSQRAVKLMLQPVVENIFIHGWDKKQTPLRILLDITAQEGRLRIEVLNNGKPIDEARARQTLDNEQSDTMHTGGIGLYNVNKRLKIKYGEAFGITDMRNRKGWTMIALEIPYRKEHFKC